MRLVKILVGMGLAVAFLGSAYAQHVTVKVYKVAAKGHGASIGEVIFVDSQYGMLIKPNLHNLSPGLHGFHIHEHPNCGDSGKAAGEHYAPQGHTRHLGPYNANGHLGDLPVLYVDHQGNASVETLAPKLKVKNIIGRSLMIHAGGDNYSDHPHLGGGGARIACGVIR